MHNRLTLDEYAYDFKYFKLEKYINEDMSVYESAAEFDINSYIGSRNPNRENNWRKIQNILLGHWQYYMYENDFKAEESDKNLSDDEEDSQSLNNIPTKTNPFAYTAFSKPFDDDDDSTECSTLVHINKNLAQNNKNMANKTVCYIFHCVYYKYVYLSNSLQFLNVLERCLLI